MGLVNIHAHLNTANLAPRPPIKNKHQHEQQWNRLDRPLLTHLMRLAPKLKMPAKFYFFKYRINAAVTLTEIIILI